MAKTNTNLHTARNNKKDEFYTRLEDIEEELKHYKEHFKNKKIICNCDDPIESNFVKYFALNFNKLQLKKLTATCYAGSPIADTDFVGELWNDLHDRATDKIAYKIEITKVEDLDGDGAITLNDINILLHSKDIVKPLIGDGDFRSAECLALLDDADICATNPPFSLLRDFFSAMVEHNKKFIILGNMNAITYKEVFPLIKENKIWTGYKFNASVIFKTPYTNTEAANRKYVLAHGCNPDEGYTKVKEITWFTNLEVTKHNEDLVMYKTYDATNYYTYHNYSAINVDNVKEIPMNYFGYIGVPITYLDKYNPEQFSIINLSRYITDSIGLDEAFVSNYNAHNKNSIPVGYKDLGYYDNDNIAIIPYMRVIIKRKYKNDGTLNTD